MLGPPVMPPIRGPMGRGRAPVAPIRPPFPPRFVGPQDMYRPGVLPPDPRKCIHSIVQFNFFRITLIIVKFCLNLYIRNIYIFSWFFIQIIIKSLRHIFEVCVLLCVLQGLEECIESH